jgi:putative ribosome biogenesis GTPase RsgA
MGICSSTPTQISESNNDSKIKVIGVDNEKTKLDINSTTSLKLVFLGDSGVGKTSLIKKLHVN